MKEEEEVGKGCEDSWGPNFFLLWFSTSVYLYQHLGLFSSSFSKLHRESERKEKERKFKTKKFLQLSGLERKMKEFKFDG